MPVLRRRMDQSIADQILASARTERRYGIRVLNDSEGILYLNEGATASATAFVERLQPGGVWREERSRGEIHGVWSAAGGGAAEVVEYL